MRLDHMAPASTINNPANVSALQPQVISYGLGCLAVCGALAYFANKVIGEHGKRVSFALFLSMISHVFDIGIMRIPTQIYKAVIASIAIFVTSLRSEWAGANESRKDQAMNVHGTRLARGVNKNQDLPAVIVVGARFEFAPSVCISPFVLVTRQDVSVWMGAVTGEIRNWLAVLRQRWNVFVHVINYITQGPMVQTCVI